MISFKGYNNAMFKLLLALLFSMKLWANPTPFMVCLGQEEATIHKNKIGGAHYRLNRELISALIQLRSTIKMKRKFEKQVCNALSPSIKMLELIMSEEIFYSKYDKENQTSNYQIDMTTINSLNRTSSQLFINFVTTMQAALPKANCMQQLVPEINEFFEKMQYILEDVGIKRVMETIKEPKKTFQKLNAINLNKPKC